MELAIGFRGLVTVEVRSRDTSRVKLLDPVPRPFAEFVDRPELDRVRRAGLGTGRDEAVLLAVVAERALVRMAVEVATRDDPERAGRDAIRAAVADVALNVDVREFVIDDGACWARMLARGRARSACRRRSSSTTDRPRRRSPTGRSSARGCRRGCNNWSRVSSCLDPAGSAGSWLVGRPFAANCSMNFTCRQVVPESSAVLS